MPQVQVEAEASWHILISTPVTTTRANRHQLLQDSLLRLFLQEGFADLRLEDLARHLQCSKSTLYTLGPSKKQITRNVLVVFFSDASERVERRAAEQDAPGRKIAEYLRGAAEALRPASISFMRDLVEQPTAAAVYQQNTAIAASRIREFVQLGVDSGAFRSVHASFVADVITSTMNRINSGETLETTGLEAADAYDQLAVVILGGLES